MGSMLGDLLRRAVSRPLAEPSKKDGDDDAAKAFTVRPSAELRLYLEERAAHLGDLPLSSLVTMILSSVKDADISGQYSDYGHYDETVNRIAERVRFLYSSFNYSLMDAVTTLEQYSITPAIFLDNKKLVDKLTMEAFQLISEAFCIRIEWLTDPMSDPQMSERPHNRHNSVGILREILKHEESGALERVIPFCRKDDLDGNRLVYSGDHGKVDAGIAVQLRPKNGFKHSRIRVWDDIPFDYSEARLEYKALLMRLYNRYPSAGIFQGAALDAKIYDRVMNGQDLVPDKMLDGLRGASVWDAEFYVGATWGENTPLEEEELGRVRAFADQYLKIEDSDQDA